MIRSEQIHLYLKNFGFLSYVYKKTIHTMPHLSKAPAPEEKQVLQLKKLRFAHD